MGNMGKHSSQTKPRQTERKRPVWQLIILDLLLTGLVLCIFATFHHVIPRIRENMSGPLTPIATVPVPQEPKTTPSPTTEPEPEDAPEPAEEPEPEPEPDPDDWAAKFSEHFTEEIVITDRSYTSPNISLTIEEYTVEHQYGNSSWPLRCFLADIYVADISYLQAALPLKGVYATAESISEENGAIFAVNGDYVVGSKKDGLCVRNGNIYATGATTSDICVLFYDGTVEIYGPKEYEEEELLARQPYQIWQFGPNLLDGEGRPLTTFNTTKSLMDRHPRTAFGYYEPGHYCFLVVDGKQPGYSLGLYMDGIAEMMAELGCTKAFNLDGGASSRMLFQGVMLNQPYSYRALKDMIILKEPDDTGLTGMEEEG